ncbi:MULTISPECIES: c-type cytochrome [Pseudomonas]|jgi:cbb3-type cytochrome c oxidase subunit III|nr:MULTISPECIES: c-type cytochrome [Pseudomonas]NBB33063.1 c-type cytochrome [Pseudomonas sp. BC115LW]WKL52784.1 c-type cytochrome [Pseudomonas kielensis]
MNKMTSLALLFLAPLATQATEAPTAALSATCAVCHGAEGQGNQALGAPRLAGQNAQYLARQLLNFKAGRRGYAQQDQAGQSMRAITQSLSEEQLASLAAHYAGLQLAKAPQSDSATAKVGAARYQDTCAACHGQFAQGYAHLQAPDLRILDGWYIDQQLNNYAQGWRGADEYSDIQGKWMQAIATQINNEERRAVVDFIETLGVDPK